MQPESTQRNQQARNDHPESTHRDRQGYGVPGGRTWRGLRAVHRQSESPQRGERAQRTLREASTQIDAQPSDAHKDSSHVGSPVIYVSASLCVCVSLPVIDFLHISFCM